MSLPVWTVREITRRIGDLLDIEFDRICVEGEISGVNIHQRSGHAYFAVKDKHALLNCICWASTLERTKRVPVDGMRMQLYGRLSVYEPRGSYNLVVDRLVPAGEGDLQAAFLELKRKLEDEGLFDTERKRPLPSYPLRIGVVTSKNGAALQDILRVLRERWPVGRVFLWPANVQGVEAVPSLAHGIRRLGRTRLDLLIVARGGGSLEDLAAFNSEPVARAIADSEVPVVSGVGHETDITIADFVSDQRAATPSQAAELATPDREDVLRTLHRDERALRRALTRRAERLRLRLERAESSRAFTRPEEGIRRGQLDLDRLADRLRRGLQRPTDEGKRRLDALGKGLARNSPEHALREARASLNLAEARWRTTGTTVTDAARKRTELAGVQLGALGPFRVLARGYSILRRPEGGKVISDAGAIESGAPVDVLLHRGELHCRVETRTLAEEGESAG